MKRLGLFFFVFCPLFVQAQLDTVYVKQWDLVRGIDGVMHTLVAPARWKANDWLVVGGVVGSTLAISLADKPVREFWLSHRSDFMDDFERVGYHYGKAYTGIAFTSGLYLTGLLIKNEWAKETGLMLATGLTTNGIVTGVFKNAIGRARPGAELGNYEADPFSKRVAFHSFPSGHTTTAFTISMIMARQVKSLGVKIVFYSLAACTAVSRLYADAHCLLTLPSVEHWRGFVQTQPCGESLAINSEVLFDKINYLLSCSHIPAGFRYVPSFKLLR